MKPSIKKGIIIPLAIQESEELLFPMVAVSSRGHPRCRESLQFGHLFFPYQ